MDWATSPRALSLDAWSPDPRPLMLARCGNFHWLFRARCGLDTEVGAHIAWTFGK